MAIAIAACGGSSAGSTVQKVGASEAVGMLDSRVVIDVRTPAEYAAGHIAGAQNIDVEAADFASRISSLDKDGRLPRLLPLGPAERDRRRRRWPRRASPTSSTAAAMADLVAAGAPTQ